MTNCTLLTLLHIIYNGHIIVMTVRRLGLNLGYAQAIEHDGKQLHHSILKIGSTKELCKHTKSGSYPLLDLDRRPKISGSLVVMIVNFKKIFGNSCLDRRVSLAKFKLLGSATALGYQSGKLGYVAI